ncbi:class I SAM-dependent methyltransferase [Paenibacillus alvei]|uniref:class I SAM-dependent methyltransferase n=1 Tax=Paenibacillus alvei TaxID=44250 RepID=UPI00228032D4|nr:class I SAM-dependent methyltransferase [Paenibacillus alvei]
MSTDHHWNPVLYDSKLQFVSQYGTDVVGWLSPQPGERILDVGCGTGDLAANMAEAGARVVGIDQSFNMIEQARNKYPSLTFIPMDITAECPGHYAGSFDAALSNAALHWVKNPEAAARHIYTALRPGGRFVAELGGKGNVEVIVRAIEEVLEQHFGIDPKPLHPWYYPTIGEYSTVLEQAGFQVTSAIHFERPTLLTDGENGLLHWLHAFTHDFTSSLSSADIPRFMELVQAKCRPTLYQNGVWTGDYKRLRIVASKPSLPT